MQQLYCEAGYLCDPAAATEESSQAQAAAEIAHAYKKSKPQKWYLAAYLIHR